MDSTKTHNIDFDTNFEHFDNNFDTSMLEIDKHSDSEHNKKHKNKNNPKPTERQKSP